jgi:diacylglycerol kinase family enzyme
VLTALRPRFGRLPLHPAGEPGEVRALASMLAQECDLLVMFGGDSTVHEVVNGLLLGPDQEASVVAVPPGGTGIDMPCRLDGEPAPTPDSVSVLAAVSQVLAPPATPDVKRPYPYRSFS